MKAAYLKPGAVILIKGERCVVRAVEYTHKDAVCVRLHGRAPLQCAWDHEVEVVDD